MPNKNSGPSAVARVNQLSFSDKVSRWWQTHCGRVPPQHPSVQWLSYHIPKTAGTSLRIAMTQAFGQNSVYGAYRFSGVHELRQGKSVWLPKSARVVHGHFYTHARHTEIFPNANRIVWVRDPIERAWSLLGRLLDVKERDGSYALLKERYLDKGITDKKELFECYINDKDINGAAVFGYRRYFKAIPPSEFDFVGSVHSIKDDMARLSERLGINVEVVKRNTRTGGKDLPESIKSLRPQFEDEYKLVEPYLRRS